MWLIQRWRDKPPPPSDIEDYIKGLLILVGFGSLIIWGILQVLVGTLIDKKIEAFVKSMEE